MSSTHQILSAIEGFKENYQQAIEYRLEGRTYSWRDDAKIEECDQLARKKLAVANQHATVIQQSVAEQPQEAGVLLTDAIKKTVDLQIQNQQQKEELAAMADYISKQQQTIHSLHENMFLRDQAELKALKQKFEKSFANDQPAGPAFCNIL